MRRFVPLLVLAALVSCGGGGGGEKASAPVQAAPTTVEVPAVAPPAVPAALNWEAKAVAGGQVAGANYAGRAVAMWFWAPW